ncbi:hypothetical protein [Kitasatospora sp. LaBMicrA B282]|uniref:hypothetical protein n=1 Tax=Kitasatospora sp. LaBMicrA B282 TaxID=3420949 RepID=UPI003D0D00A6
MNHATTSAGWMRWALALMVGLLTAALASGCGIRPTAVPVDAGAPASRTACPSPVHPPAAPSNTANPAGGVGSPGRPGATPSPVLGSGTPGSPFSALPSPVASPSGSPGASPSGSPSCQ